MEKSDVPTDWQKVQGSRRLERKRHLVSWKNMANVRRHVFAKIVFLDENVGIFSEHSDNRSRHTR